MNTAIGIILFLVYSVNFPVAKCTPGGCQCVSASPHNCHEYTVTTSGGVPEVLRCTDGLLFNPTTLTCDYRENVECEPQWDCPSRFGAYPHPTNCSRYYECSQWVPVVMTCPSGLHFNANLSVCDWPGGAGCETTTPIYELTSTRPPPITSVFTSVWHHSISTYLPPTTDTETEVPPSESPTLLTTEEGVNDSSDVTNTNQSPISLVTASSREEPLVQTSAKTDEVDTETSAHDSKETESSTFASTILFTKTSISEGNSSPSSETSDSVDSSQGEDFHTTDGPYSIVSNSTVENDGRSTYASTLSIENDELTETEVTNGKGTTEGQRETETSLGTSTENVSMTTNTNRQVYTGTTNISSVTAEFSSSISAGTSDDRTTLDDMLPFKCPERFGLYADPHNCSTFYHCSHFYPYKKVCPSNLHFNAELQVCDWPDQAGCGKTSVGSTTLTTMTDPDMKPNKTTTFAKYSTTSKQTDETKTHKSTPSITEKQVQPDAVTTETSYNSTTVMEDNVETTTAVQPSTLITPHRITTDTDLLSTTEITFSTVITTEKDTQSTNKSPYSTTVTTQESVELSRDVSFSTIETTKNDTETSHDVQSSTVITTERNTPREREAHLTSEDPLATKASESDVEITNSESSSTVLRTGRSSETTNEMTSSVQVTTRRDYQTTNGTSSALITERDKTTNDITERVSETSSDIPSTAVTTENNLQSTKNPLSSTIVTAQSDAQTTDKEFSSTVAAENETETANEAVNNETITSVISFSSQVITERDSQTTKEAPFSTVITTERVAHTDNELSSTLVTTEKGARTSVVAFSTEITTEKEPITATEVSSVLTTKNEIQTNKIPVFTEQTTLKEPEITNKVSYSTPVTVDRDEHTTNKVPFSTVVTTEKDVETANEESSPTTKATITDSYITNEVLSRSTTITEGDEEKENEVIISSEVTTERYGRTTNNPSLKIVTTNGNGRTATEMPSSSIITTTTDIQPKNKIPFSTIKTTTTEAQTNAVTITLTGETDNNVELNKTTNETPSTPLTSVITRVEPENITKGIEPTTTEVENDQTQTNVVTLTITGETDNNMELNKTTNETPSTPLTSVITRVEPENTTKGIEPTTTEVKDDQTQTNAITLTITGETDSYVEFNKTTSEIPPTLTSVITRFDPENTTKVTEATLEVKEDNSDTPNEEFTKYSSTQKLSTENSKNTPTKTFPTQSDASTKVSFVSTSTSEYDTTTLRLKNFTCPSRFGLFPDPDSCYAFYQCSHWRAVRIACPSQLHFNPKLMVCDWPYRAGCDLMSKPADDSTNVIPITPNIPPNGCDPTKGCPPPTCPEGDALVAAAGDCTSFFQCAEGKAYRVLCPPGLHFNTQWKVCEHPCDALCDPRTDCSSHDRRKRSVKEDIPCESDNRLTPHPDDCSAFYWCWNGRFKLFYCPEGLHFDTVQGKCEEPIKARCRNKDIERKKIHQNILV